GGRATNCLRKPVALSSRRTKLLRGFWLPQLLLVSRRPHSSRLLVFGHGSSRRRRWRDLGERVGGGQRIHPLLPLDVTVGAEDELPYRRAVLSLENPECVSVGR